VPVGLDLVEMENPALQSALEEGLLEPLDWIKLGIKADFLPGAVRVLVGVFFVGSTSLSY
ncbi:ABC transporter substrate-binding protein, partial [Erwinia amylovora]|nr:ABC transporter substrate-binding protein [Erwinia amylovora]